MDWPEITEDTPLEEVRRIHKAIWQYAIENGEKPKTPYKANCALCEYIRVHKLSCAFCPARWQMELKGGLRESHKCSYMFSPYYYWEKYHNHETVPYTQTQLAEMIRDIPFKELDD